MDADGNRHLFFGIQRSATETGGGRQADELPLGDVPQGFYRLGVVLEDGLGDGMDFGGILRRVDVCPGRT